MKGCVELKISISTIAPIKTLLRALADDCGGATMIGFCNRGPAVHRADHRRSTGRHSLSSIKLNLQTLPQWDRDAFALGRRAQPYTNTIKAIANSGRLPLGSSNVTLSVGGTVCTSDATCLAALNTAYYVSGAHYSPASWTTVTVTYRCPTFLPTSWLALARVCSGTNESPPGFLTDRMSQPVQ